MVKINAYNEMWIEFPIVLTGLIWMTYLFISDFRAMKDEEKYKRYVNDDALLIKKIIQGEKKEVFGG